MAEPKKKLSKTRTHLRRAQYKVSAPTVKLCPNCGNPTLPHMICAHCGYYKGKAVKSSAPTKRIVLDSSETEQK